MKAAAAQAYGPRRILSAISLTSSASLTAIAFSVVTNKIIALVGGAPGVALMGLFRGLGSAVTQTLALGAGTIIVQRVSTARSKAEAGEVVGAAGWLLAFQGAVVFLLAALFAGKLARGLFGGASSGHVLEVRVVLAMALVNLALQLVMAVLQGHGELKLITAVQAATSASTLALIYPLLLWGGTGLAVNVGSGSMVGLALGAFLIWNRHRGSLSRWPALEQLKVLRGIATPSALLTFQTVALMGGALAVQAMINRHYGLEALGGYNAALLIVETGVMIVMASSRSYFLPSLGKLADPKDKETLQSRMVSALLGISLCAALTLIFMPRLVLWLLFSSKFVWAARLLAVLSLSFLGHALIWSYNTYLLHKGDIGLFVGLDSLRQALLVAAVYVCARRGLPIESAAWAYAFVLTLGGLLYAACTLRAHGRGLASRRAISVAGAGFLCLGLGFWAARRLGL